MRSSQLDAERLDEELTSMLREQLLRCASWVLQPGLLARLQPELTLLLDLLVSVPALICMILICIIRAAEAPENTTAAHFMAVAGLPTACLM